MPERKYDNGSGYRYGFNGKEMDKETSPTTTYDYGFRIYSPALGKFLSVDPLTKSYPWFSPYQFAGNSPILNIDLDGLENQPTQPNTQPQNPDERFMELHDKFKDLKPYLKDLTKVMKVFKQFQIGVYAAKVITEAKIFDLKNRIMVNDKMIDKLKNSLNKKMQVEKKETEPEYEYEGPGGGRFGGGGAVGDFTSDPTKPVVKTAEQIRKEQIQKSIETLKTANENLEWEKQEYETVREGLNEFTMFGDVQDEVLDFLKVVKDPTPENIQNYLEDKATQYVKDRLLEGLTKEKTKEKNKAAASKKANGQISL
jgi:RHS repeat-associated protein